MERIDFKNPQEGTLLLTTYDICSKPATRLALYTTDGGDSVQRP